MRVRLRVSIYTEGRKLRRRDLEGMREPLYVGMRYITESKYLEATKWLMVAGDCWEKYALLTLINLSLGQEDLAREFLLQTEDKDRLTQLEFSAESPEEGFSFWVRSTEDLRKVFSHFGVAY